MAVEVTPYRKILHRSGSTLFSYYRVCQPLPTVLGGEVATRDLGDDVAVEEACQNQSLGTRVPLKVRQLELDYFDQTKHVI